MVQKVYQVAQVLLPQVAWAVPWTSIAEEGLRVEVTQMLVANRVLGRRVLEAVVQGLGPMRIVALVMRGVVKEQGGVTAVAEAVGEDAVAVLSWVGAVLLGMERRRVREAARAAQGVMPAFCDVGVVDEQSCVCFPRQG